MITKIKTLEIENSTLNVTSAGRRRYLADFNGKIEIYEEQKYVSILGNNCKGIKRIYASFIFCDDTRYNFNDEFHSGKVYEAVGDVQGEHMRESTVFSGLKFEEYNPIDGSVIFEITDLELIRKMLTM